MTGVESAIIPLVGISDQVWLALITLGTGVVSMIGASFAGYIAFKQSTLKHDIDKQSKQLTEISTTNKEIAKTSKATYTFANHQYGVALKSVAVACRSKAEITKKNDKYDKTDLAEAEAAEEAYAEHQRGQAKVDAQAVITRAEEQARKLLREQQGVAEPEESLEPKEVEEIQKEKISVEVAKQIEASTQTIEGTVQLTPVEDGDRADQG